MYKIEVKLKQHTPLIHFQWEQEGATLRASEVKPKLDRFILIRLGQEKDSEQYKKGEQAYSNSSKTFSKPFETLKQHEKGYWIAKALNWLVGEGEHPALDYKMKIINKGRMNHYTQKIINNPKELCLYEDIQLSILSFQQNIIDKIEEKIAEFFCISNFGFCQSKGFGSFSVNMINGKSINLGENEYIYFLANTYYQQIISLSFDRSQYETYTFTIWKLNEKDKQKLEDADKKLLSSILRLEGNNPDDWRWLCFSEKADKIFEDYDCQIKTNRTQLEIKKDKYCISILAETPKEKRKKKKEDLNKSFQRKNPEKKDILFHYYKSLYRYIDQTLYKPLKSGLNRPYTKAIIYKYFEEELAINKKVAWEKRYIKQAINRLPLKDRWNLELPLEKIKRFHKPCNSDNSGYVRALFGIAENFEFNVKDNNKKFVVGINNIETAEEHIDRFQSIVFFKVIDSKIYICLNKLEILKNILGKKYQFTLWYKQYKGKDKGWEEMGKSQGEGVKLGDPICIPKNFECEELYKYILGYLEQNFVKNEIHMHNHRPNRCDA